MVGPLDEDLGSEGRPSQDTAVVVVFFDDIKGSTVLKERMAASSDEQAFQMLRKEHDVVVTEIITRDGAGEVIKSTGDGLLAILHRPSVAVERAIEIQERLHDHPFIKVRIGMDMGEVSVESDALRHRDAFGRHVDWAARAMDMAEAGHICVTRPVYLDAFSWIRKSRIAWKEHGPHRVKPGEPPLDVFEPFNANIVKPMEVLRGEKVTPEAPVETRALSPPEPAGTVHENVRLARSWEFVARDGREFAEHGAGMMYWFRVPLGGVCYPEGFRNFLQPALENPQITKIRFMLNSAAPRVLADLDGSGAAPSRGVGDHPRESPINSKAMRQAAGSMPWATTRPMSGGYRVISQWSSRPVSNCLSRTRHRSPDRKQGPNLPFHRRSIGQVQGRVAQHRESS